jgi:thioester reductase-like protein
MARTLRDRAAGIAGQPASALGSAVARRLQIPEKPLRGAPAPTDVFRGTVQAAKIGADNDIPHLSAALIDKYVADLQLLSLV